MSWNKALLIIWSTKVEESFLFCVFLSVMSEFVDDTGNFYSVETD